MGETGKLRAEMIFGLDLKGWNIPPAEGRKILQGKFSSKENESG